MSLGPYSAAAQFGISKGSAGVSSDSIGLAPGPSTEGGATGSSGAPLWSPKHRLFWPTAMIAIGLIGLGYATEPKGILGAKASAHAGPASAEAGVEV